MPFFVMIGRDGPRGGVLRPEVRPRHLAHLEPLAREGRVAFAGPLFEDDGKTPRGSVIVFEAPSLEEARAIATRDPYVVEGVFDRHEVRPSARVFPRG
jgi:uncharacterized protein YciI